MADAHTDYFESSFESLRYDIRRVTTLLEITKLVASHHSKFFRQGRTIRQGLLDIASTIESVLNTVRIDPFLTAKLRSEMHKHFLADGYTPEDLEAWADDVDADHEALTQSFRETGIMTLSLRILNYLMLTGARKRATEAMRDFALLMDALENEPGDAVSREKLLEELNA